MLWVFHAIDLNKHAYSLIPSQPSILTLGLTGSNVTGKEAPLLLVLGTNWYVTSYLGSASIKY